MQKVIPAGEGVRILDFSPRIRDALRQISHVQRREYDTASPLVRVTSLTCATCGFDKTLDGTAVVHADYLRAVTLVHELSWLTGKHCGGQLEATSEPAERAVGVFIRAW